jgi:uncharacterized integral membrane protein
MRLLKKLFWFGLFFVLFAFALNNQHNAVIHWFFGMSWQGPMVFVVLGVFGLGCLCGVLAMSPHWWQGRRGASRSRSRVPGQAGRPVNGLAAEAAHAARAPHDGV